MNFTKAGARSARFASTLLFFATLLSSAANAETDAGSEKIPAAVRQFAAKNFPAAQTFQSASAFANDFGFSVAMNERFAVIGAPGEPATTIAYGTIYIYQRINSSTTPWVFIQSISASQLESFANQGADRFGESVALSGSTLVVGSPQDTDDGNGTVRVGSAYVFTYDRARLQTPGFVLRAKLLASAAGLGVGGNAFGASVAIAGTHVLVGAPGADQPGFTNVGAAVLYTCARTTPPQLSCVLRANLAPSDLRAAAEFGASVAAAAPLRSTVGVLVIGAPGQCANATCAAGVPEGAAYAYNFTGPGPLPPQQKLRDAIPASGARFGASVAADGIAVAVGAPADAAGVGSVRLFVRGAGGFQTGLQLKPRAVQAMAFGKAVSLSGTTLVVGAPSRSVGTPEPANTGAAYLYEQVRGQWILRDELFRTLSTSGSQFGQAVAAGGGALLIGEPSGPTPPTSSPGRAYGYRVGRGAKITGIANPNIAPNTDHYGRDVAVSGGFMAVGLPDRDSAGTPNVGEVRLYQQTPAGGWAPTNQNALAFPEAVLANARFGRSVALTENASHLIVGAPGAFAGAGGNAGAVFVYERRGAGFVPAVQRFKLVRPGGSIGDDFGAALDASPTANLLIVGAPESNGGVGGVTIFRDTTAPAPTSGKVGRAKFDDGGNVPPPVGGGIGDKWGSSVATDGEQAVAGAPETDDANGDGYATMIEESGGTYGNTETLTPPADAGGAGTDQQDFGSSVDIGGGMVAVGAPGTDLADDQDGGMNNDEGAAYGYALGDPLQPVVLDQAGGGIGDKWGAAVAVDDDGSLVAGGPGADVPTDSGLSIDQGAAASYECYINPQGALECGFVETLYGLGAQDDEAIGSAIDLEGGDLVLGAPDAAAADDGAVYVTEDLFPFDGLFRDGFE